MRQNFFMSKFILKNKIKILTIIFISLGLFCVYFLNSPHPASIKIESSPLLIKERGWGEVTFEYKNIKQITVYDFMQKLQKEGEITFKDKTYAGMGKFIEEINGIKNNGEKNWIYYVNNVKANIGVSNYKINKGDIVSWKYE